MTYLVALKCWREILIGLLAFLLILMLMLLEHQSKKIDEAETKCNAKILKLKEDQLTELQKKQNEINKVSADYETEKSKQRVQVETVTREVQKIVERPVYLNSCFDDDGMQQLNSLIASGASKPP